MPNPALALEKFKFEEFECCVYASVSQEGDIEWSCTVSINDMTMLHVCKLDSKAEVKTVTVKALKKLASRFLAVCNHLTPSGN